MILYNLTKRIIFAICVLFCSLISINLIGQSNGSNRNIQLKNFKSINTSINENCFNKIGREFFLLEIDIQESKFFPPSMQLSQSVFKTRETLAIEDLEVEEFYYLLNHDFVYTGAIVSYNEKDFIFSATKRHGDGVIKPGQTLQLYTANIEDEYFTNIEPLPFSQKAFNFCHPSLRSNGNLLIFASDMPGGHGGYDLYAAARIDGVWSKPYNLGPKINSIDDELYPFFSDDGYLYFSSDRFGGAGETDIYVSERMDDGWSAAANLGKPYNSKSHDYGFRLLNYKGYGTLSSDRAGGVGIDDIYTFRHFREEENRNLIKNEGERDTTVDNLTAGSSSVTNITNNYYNFQNIKDAGIVEEEAYVIFYQSESDYSMVAYNQDKEAFVKALPVATAKKYKVKDLATIKPGKDQFVQIKIKGFKDVYLNPAQASASHLNFDFIKKGWKPLPGHVIFSDGVPADDVTVDLVSLDGESKVMAKTDEHGKFNSRVMSDKNYSVRLHRDGLQVIETFEFNPENFDQLIMDMTVSQAFHQKVVEAVDNIPIINENTAGYVISPELVAIQVNEGSKGKVKSETSPIVEISDFDSTAEPKGVPYAEEPEEVAYTIIEEEPAAAVTPNGKRGYTGDETGNFYVIAGTFSAEYRAVRRINLLASKGIAAKLIKVAGSPYFKIMVDEYNDLIQAIEKEKEVYSAIKDSYILRKESDAIEVIK